jgi:hypothetical protein
MALDDLPPDARAIVAAMRHAHDPTSEDRRRIDTAMAAALSGYGVFPPTHAAGAGSAARSAASLTAGKVALGLVGVAAVIAGAAWTQLDRPAQAGQSTRPSAPSLAGPAAARASAARPEPAVEAPPLVSDRPSTVPMAAPLRARMQRTAHVPRAGGATGAAPPSAAPRSGEDPLRAEVALVESANDALRLGRYERALRLLDAHAERFASGALVEECSGLRVLALCGLGQVELGRREQQHFLREAPHSVLAQRVRHACAPGDSRARE